MLSTAIFLARRGLNESIGREAADWAAGQLELGFDGKYLRQLAGILGDENKFEVNELIDRCIREQNLRFPKAESVVILYAQDLCRQFQQGMIDKVYLLRRSLRFVPRMACCESYCRFIFWTALWTICNAGSFPSIAGILLATTSIKFLNRRFEN